VLAARDALTPEIRAEAAARLAALIDTIAVTPGAIVAGYMPIRSEIDPRPLMAALAARGARLCLPVVAEDRETLIFREWHAGAALEPSGFGLSVPTADAAELAPDVLLLPLAVFDAAGNRIGYGKGHYDRALARLEAVGPRRKIGLAFALQRVDAVPAEPHDRPLDLILTEDGPRVPITIARARAPDARRGGDAA
jgi:5-formyltetrahydrofolate cyclo-ligase